MPLVVICGLPASGKTRVAEAIVAYLRAQEPDQDVVHITEASVNVSRRDGYRDAREEKNARSALKAAVEKAVNAKTIVVLDALNYIKGSRYELFCKAKAESTTYCVVFVDTPLALALERNARRTDQFDPELIEAIAARFETPVAKNRWDNPLFHITPSTNDDDDVESLPLAAIAAAVYTGKTVQAGQATRQAPAVETSFKQQLDDITLHIADALIAHQRDGSVADALRVPHVETALLCVPRAMAATEVRRHRRQFIKIAHLRPCATSAIGDLFVAYVNEQVGK